MANFIKKIVDRARSRSKSPVKYQRNDYELWRRMKQPQQQPSYYGSPTGTYDYFVHPEYDPPLQDFHETHRWDIRPSHQSDIVHPYKELITSEQLNPIHDDMINKHNETFDSLSNPTDNWEHRSSASLISNKRKEFNFNKKGTSRPRSSSPQKTPRTSPDDVSKKSRSKSPIKRFPQISETLNYLTSRCQLGGCSATIIVQDTKFLVCKHQLSHVSDYFRALFSANKPAAVSAAGAGGACSSSCDEFAVVVSSFKHPPPAVQFKWFLESAIQTAAFTDITDDTLETCMRLSKRFRAKYLEMKCAKYIQDNVSKRTPMVALCWLNWVLKHKFDRITHDACLPCVAAASVQCLEEHRNLISERLLADLLAAKLRTLYDQVATSKLY